MKWCTRGVRVRLNSEIGDEAKAWSESCENGPSPTQTPRLTYKHDGGSGAAMAERSSIDVVRHTTVSIHLGEGTLNQ